jgi:hypothetical protein
MSKERESIEFEGRTYYRYVMPDGSQPSQRYRYFVNKEHLGVVDGRKRQVHRSLHREIWRSQFGDIPSGYHIDHIDGDWNNNDISNLQCMSPGEHRAKHADQMSDPAIVEAAREGARRGREAQLAIRKKCERCGGEYRSACPTSKFCGDQCYRDSVNQRNREKSIPKPRVEHTRNCKACGSEFRTFTRDKAYCDAKCRNNFTAKERRRVALERIVQCECCGNVFTTIYKNKRFCDRKCKRRGARLRPDG